MPTLRQLRYLDAVIRHRNFSRAAEECHVSQPALSQQIRELEARLGSTLIERTSTEARPTALGLEVVARARDILGRVGELTEVARHHGRLLAGPLRLGVIPSIAPYALPKILPELARAYPECDLMMRESQTANLLAEVAEGKLDVALIALPAGRVELEDMALFDDAFLLAVPVHRAEEIAPAARRPTIAEVVAKERLLLLEEGHCLRDQTLALCGPMASEIRSQLGATSLTTILRMVAAGYGVTLLPAMSVASETGHDPALTVLPFADPPPHRSIGLTWRRTATRKADFRALGELIRRVLAPRG
jgi:LysR family hydrogen peroxide-inducible transcriptional activator